MSSYLLTLTPSPLSTPPGMPQGRVLSPIGFCLAQAEKVESIDASPGIGVGLDARAVYATCAAEVPKAPTEKHLMLPVLAAKTAAQWGN